MRVEVADSEVMFFCCENKVKTRNFATAQMYSISRYENLRQILRSKIRFLCDKIRALRYIECRVSMLSADDLSISCISDDDYERQYWPLN